MNGALSPTRNAHAESVRRLAAAMLRTGCAFGVVAAVAAMVVAVVVAGWEGWWGASVGVGLGFGSCLATIGLMRLTAALPVQSLFGAVLGGYAVKVGLLMVVAVPLRGIGQLHPLSLGLSIVAVVLAWAVAEVVAFFRTPIPTVIPDPTPSTLDAGVPPHGVGADA